MSGETTRLGISIPSRLGAMDRLAGLAEQAEQAGFDSAWVIELYRNPFTMLYGAAPSTSRIGLGTGVATALTRSPFEAANLAADVDEISGGRTLIGLGAGSPELLAAFHSAPSARPVQRMREFVTCMRRAWEYLDNDGQAEPFEGELFQFTPPPFMPWGYRSLPRPRIPILMAGIGPVMTRLAGELGDGWIGYLATPEWMRDRVRPRLEEGAAVAGRSLDGFDCAVEVICSVHPDRDVALRRGRIQTGFYVGHPVSDPMIEHADLHAERDVVRDALATKGLAGLLDTPESLVEAFSIVGTPEEGRQKLARFQSEISHVILHTPYVPPISEEEGDDAFGHIIDAFARA